MARRPARGPDGKGTNPEAAEAHEAKRAFRDIEVTVGGHSPVQAGNSWTKREYRPVVLLVFITIGIAE